jgi:hypothetical protein
MIVWKNPRKTNAMNFGRIKRSALKNTFWLLLSGYALFSLAACQTTGGGNLFEQKPEDAIIGAHKPYQAGSATHKGACNIDADTIWQDTDRGRYRIEAQAVGESCETAKLTMTVRTPTKRVILRKNFEAKEINGFEMISDPRLMRRALINWMTNNGRTARTTGDLPEWIEAQYSRLTLVETVERDSYIRLRKQKRPLLCFTDSNVSKLCLVLSSDGNKFFKIGTLQLGTAKD